MRSLFSAMLAFSLSALACSGADQTDLLGGGGADARADVVVGDGGPSDAPTGDVGPQPTICATDADNCTAPVVPPGFKPVAIVKGAQPCPQDYGPSEDVVADPTINAAKACSCTCAKTQDPDCQTGTTTVTGVGQTCNGFSVNLSYSGGACRKTSGTVDDYDKATTIAPAGGACSIQTVPNDGALGSEALRLCPAGAKCASAACGGYAPKGFTACIVADGDVACPMGSPFSTKHLVGAQAHVQCTSCGSACTFQGKCDSPKLSFYSDQSCTQLVVSIPANGACTQTGKANATIGGTMYTATPNFSGCTATGAPTPSVDVQGARTVCCRP